MDTEPVPAPHGALVPPPRRPPTAVGLGEGPLPDDASGRAGRGDTSPWRRLAALAASAIDDVLDAADVFADGVAEAIGLRGRRR